MGLLLALLFALMALAEPWLWWWSMPLGQIAVFHVLVATLSALAWLPGYGRWIALRAWMIGLMAPVVGPLGVWLAYRAPSGQHNALVAAYRDYVAFAALEVPIAPIIDYDEAVRRELLVRPFVDELRWGDLTAKQAAAEALVTLQTANAVTILRSVLGDPDGETRLFASLALGQIEERHAARLESARLGTLQAPQDANSALALVETLRAYAETGLPQGEAALAIWAEIVQIAKALVELPLADSAKQPIWLNLALAHSHLGQALPALEAATLARDLNPAHPQARLARCEALFALGDIAALRAEACALQPLVEAGTPEAGVAQFWGDHAG